MKKPAFIKPTNPVRAWSRRIVRGTQGRPDVQILQLQRRIEILEGLTDVSARAGGWVDAFITSLTPYQFAALPLERRGSAYDGGYVLPAGLPKAVTGVVSIGVGDNNDVDVQLAEEGLTVHAWDHTVAGLPTVHNAIAFHRVGLGRPDEDPSLMTLADIVDASFNSQAGDLLLLIDAEGAEWQQLATCPDDTLNRFGVIGIELHDLGDLILDPTEKLAVLQRLNMMFVPVAIHPNNHAAVWTLPGIELPDALEVTYVNRRLVNGGGMVGNCPGSVTAPCCPDLPETTISWVS